MVGTGPAVHELPLETLTTSTLEGCCAIGAESAKMNMLMKENIRKRVRSNKENPKRIKKAATCSKTDLSYRWLRNRCYTNAYRKFMASLPRAMGTNLHCNGTRSSSAKRAIMVMSQTSGVLWHPEGRLGTLDAHVKTSELHQLGDETGR